MHTLKDFDTQASEWGEGEERNIVCVREVLFLSASALPPFSMDRNCCSVRLCACVYIGIYVHEWARELLL